MPIVRSLFLLFPLLFINCYIFSNFQSSRLLHQNEFEVGPSFSCVTLPTSEYKNNTMGQLGIQMGYGVNDKFNLRGRIVLMNQFDSVSRTVFDHLLPYVEIEPKIRLRSERSSFSLPVGIYIGEMVQLMPSFTFSQFITRSIDMNYSPKVLFVIFPIKKGLYGGLCSFAFNYGIALTSFNEKVILSPEIGINTYNFKSLMYSFGLGLSFTIKKKNAH